MQWFRMRPTFDLVVPCDAAVLQHWLLQECKRVGNKNSFLMYREYGELHLPASEHRLWSPHLSFYLKPDHEQTIVHGRFAPRVDIWTSVWIAYLLAIFSAFFSLMFAYSQWMLKESPWALWIAGAAVAALLLIYVTAHLVSNGVLIKWNSCISV